MAIDLNNWVPKYVKQVLGYSSGQSIKAARWNELWNLSIEQGDYNSETLDLLIDLVNTKSDDEEIKEILDTKADQTWVVSQLALKTDVSVFDAFRNQQNSTNQTVQTALNNRYTKAETDERLNLKFDKTDAQPLLKEVTFDAQTGVFTITRQNGTTFQINTLLEKVPVQFLLEDNKLILIAEDGTRQEADLSAFIDVYTFQDSATVQFVQTMPTNRTVTASVKDKSIGFEQLKDNVYQSISDDRVAAEAAAESALASKTAAENAAAQATTKASEASQSAATALESKNAAVASAEAAVVSEQSAERDALMAQSYAVGGTGLRPGEDTDNAKYYAQQAGEIAGGDFATKTELQQHEQYAEEIYAKKDDVPQGVIKADGTTVTSAMIPFAQGAKNTSGALGEAQFRNVYFGEAELVEGESELPEGTLYITPDVDSSGGSSLPSGGTSGQVLTKTEDGAEWADAPSGSDPDAIKKDGTTTTTARIPFAQGISLHNGLESYSGDGMIFLRTTDGNRRVLWDPGSVSISSDDGGAMKSAFAATNKGPRVYDGDTSGKPGQVLTAKGDGTCGWADASGFSLVGTTENFQWYKDSNNVKMCVVVQSISVPLTEGSGELMVEGPPAGCEPVNSAINVGAEFSCADGYFTLSNVYVATKFTNIRIYDSHGNSSPGHLYKGCVFFYQ